MCAFRSFRPAVLFACLSVCTASMADNFGLTMGLASHELKTVKDDGAPAGMLRILTVPIPSGGYDKYLGQFSDEQGLCWVKAIGIDINSTPTGEEARSEFTVEKLRLIKLYGPAKEYDFKFRGETGDDLDNWLRAVNQGDRYVAAIWQLADGVDLPLNLESIGLVLNAASSEIAYLSLENTYNNIALCEQEIQQKN